MKESEDILLAKWLSGEISEEDKKLLLETYDLEALENILTRQESYTPSVVEGKQMWESLQKAKSGSSISSSADSKGSKKGRRAGRFIAGLLILLLGIGIWWYIQNSNTTVIETEDAPTTNHLFADGSSAIIGPGSRLAYDATEWDKARRVHLSGQAFFDVNKGVEFVVSTDAGSVEVLGTQFDVWSIDEYHMRVSCTEGMVRVTDQSERSFVLIPGQELYIIDGQVGRSEALSKEAKDWRKSYRNYRETPIEIVLLDLERFYSVTFDAAGSVSDDIFTGTLPTNDLDKCIRFIETSLSYDSQRQGKNITFSRLK